MDGKLFPVIGTLLVTFLLLPGIVLADIDTKRGEAQDVQSEISQLNIELAQALDEYAEASERLDQLNEEIWASEQELEEVAGELGRSIQILNKRATGIYKYGSVYSIEIILESKNINDLIERLNLLTRVGNKDADVVREIEAQKRVVEEKARILNAQREEQKALTEQLRAQKDEIDSKLGDKTDVLASIIQDITSLEEEEAQRAAEAARNRGSGRRNPGATLYSPITGAGWSDFAPGEWSDHGPAGHGVWLGGDAYDVMCGNGVVVYAAHSGTVTEVAGGNNRYGWTVIEGSGFATCYAHAEPYFSVGSSVVAGEPIAIVQGFGHLHFELIDGGGAVPAGDYQFYF